MDNAKPAPIEITKRKAWEMIKQDSFLKLLAEKFGCQSVTIKGKTWRKNAPQG